MMSLRSLSPIASLRLCPGAGVGTPDGRPSVAVLPYVRMIVVPFRSSVVVVEAVGLVEDDWALVGEEEAVEEGVADEVAEEEVFEDEEDEEVAVERVEEDEANVDVGTEVEADEFEVADNADVLVDDEDEVTVSSSSSSSSSSSPPSLSVGDGLADVVDVDADVDEALDVAAVVSSSSASSSSSVGNGAVGTDVGGVDEVVDVDSSTSSSSPLSSAPFADGLPSLVPPEGSCVGSGSSLRIGAVTSLLVSSSSS